MTDQPLAPPTCTHCGREIEDRGTPHMNGWRSNWVHVPGGHSICHPQQAVGSTRAELPTGLERKACCGSYIGHYPGCDRTIPDAASQSRTTPDNPAASGDTADNPGTACERCGHSEDEGCGCPPAATAYPHADGEFTVLGPEIFASSDGAVICWKGENYVRQPALPERAQAAIRALEQQVKLRDEQLAEARAELGPVRKARRRLNYRWPPETRLYDAARELADANVWHPDSCEWHTNGASYCSCGVWPAACAGVDATFDAFVQDGPTEPAP